MMIDGDRWLPQNHFNSFIGLFSTATVAKLTNNFSERSDLDLDLDLDRIHTIG